MVISWSDNADDATDTSIAYKKQAKKAVQYNRSSTNSSRSSTHSSSTSDSSTKTSSSNNN